MIPRKIKGLKGRVSMTEQQNKFTELLQNEKTKKYLIAAVVFLAALVSGFSIYLAILTDARLKSEAETPVAETVPEPAPKEEELEPAPEAEPKTVIMCYGDSNTWGFNPEVWGTRYAKEYRWPTILQEELGDSYLVIPEGLSGRTTGFDPVDSDTYLNGKYYLKTAVASNYPVNIIIFFLGTNDVKPSQNVSVQEITDAMEDLVKTSKSFAKEIQGYEPKIIVVSPPAFWDGIEHTWIAEMFNFTSVQKSKGLESMYQEMAEANDCIFVDGTYALEVSEADYIHLTRQGHQQLADLLYEAVRSIGE